MARVHSYEWVQDALLDGQEDDDGEHASHTHASMLPTSGEKWQNRLQKWHRLGLWRAF